MRLTRRHTRRGSAGSALETTSTLRTTARQRSTGAATLTATGRLTTSPPPTSPPSHPTRSCSRGRVPSSTCDGRRSAVPAAHTKPTHLLSSSHNLLRNENTDFLYYSI